MVQQKKVEAVSEMLETVRQAKASIFVDYRGMTVAEATKLRARCREAKVSFHVVKNRLALRAFNQAGAEPPQGVLTGPTAIAFGVEEPTAPARVFTDFLKSTEHLKIKGGFLGNRWLDKPGVEALSKVPTREVLLARFSGSLKGPMTRLVWGLRSPAGKIAMAFKAIAEKKTA